MARRKTQDFPPDDRQLADMAKALGHPARIAILRILAKRGTCICGEIVDGLPLAQSTVSQHLKALKTAGLVEGEVDGPRSCYCLNGKALWAAFSALDRMCKGMKKAADSCCYTTKEER